MTFVDLEYQGCDEAQTHLQRGPRCDDRCSKRDDPLPLFSDPLAVLQYPTQLAIQLWN